MGSKLDADFVGQGVNIARGSTHVTRGRSENHMKMPIFRYFLCLAPITPHGYHPAPVASLHRGGLAPWGWPPSLPTGDRHTPARSTAQEYVRRFEQADISWPLPQGMVEADLNALMFYPPPVPSAAQGPDWQSIHRELSRKDMTLKRLWLEYRAQHLGGNKCSRFLRAGKTFASKLAHFENIMAGPELLLKLLHKYQHDCGIEPH